MTGPQPTAAEAPGAVDLAEIFYRPSSVFQRRRNADFGLPLVVLIAGSVVLYYATRGLLQPVFDAEWARNTAAILRSKPTLTPDQIEQGRAFAEKLAVVGVFLVAAVGPFIAGLIAWLVGKLVGIRQTASAAIMVAVFAFFPGLLQQVVSAIQGALLSPDSITSRFSLSLGPARFLPPTTSNAVLGLVGHVDLFAIWMACLFGIGARVTGGATRGQAVAVGALMWAVGLLPTAWAALRGA